mmetsp:Transcript_79584/g.234016  ORF Transcript_79584/g.234016 Transcript_79584/m.234016 type:complete len:253 (+) Transcript_79584:116-874(+)
MKAAEGQALRGSQHDAVLNGPDTMLLAFRLRLQARSRHEAELVCGQRLPGAGLPVQGLQTFPVAVAEREVAEVHVRRDPLLRQAHPGVAILRSVAQCAQHRLGRSLGQVIGSQCQGAGHRDRKNRSDACQTSVQGLDSCREARMFGLRRPRAAFGGREPRPALMAFVRLAFDPRRLEGRAGVSDLLFSNMKASARGIGRAQQGLHFSDLLAHEEAWALKRSSKRVGSEGAATRQGCDAQPNWWHRGQEESSQ